MATLHMPPREQAATHVEPVLLLQLQDELARARKREAFWISIIVHIGMLAGLAYLPSLLPAPRAVAVASTADLLRDQEVRFLALPPDLAPPPAEKPKTDIISDKDRLAASRAPRLEPEALRDGFRPGPPQRSSPPRAQAAPAPPRGGPPPSPEERQQADRQPSESAAQRARLEPPTPGGGATPGFGGPPSPGTAIEQAARAAVGGRGAAGGVGGDFGLGAGSPARMGSHLDILSDTMGVDFGPYLARILHQVRANWLTLIPEVARPPLMRRGQVSIEFAITKNGQVAGMRLTSPSGDVSLDRAAWGGITASSPFPPLPAQFGGEHLALRFHFFYNPGRDELR
jgi:TonB family protein